MIAFLKRFFTPTPTPTIPPRITVYQMGALGSVSMTEQELMTAIQAGKQTAAFRAVVQIIEGMANNAQVMALWDQRIKDGMAPHYLMAQSYLSDLLDDIRDYAKGTPPKRVRKPGQEP